MITQECWLTLGRRTIAILICLTMTGCAVRKVAIAPVHFFCAGDKAKQPERCSQVNPQVLSQPSACPAMSCN